MPSGRDWVGREGLTSTDKALRLGRAPRRCDWVGPVVYQRTTLHVKTAAHPTAPHTHVVSRDLQLLKQRFRLRAPSGIVGQAREGRSIGRTAVDDDEAE